jgi:hypothetical protein
MRHFNGDAQVATMTWTLLILAAGRPLPASARDARIEPSSRHSYNFKIYLRITLPQP